MKDTILEDSNSFFIQMQTKLQEERENYKRDNTSFMPYLKTMDKIDLWLNSGENSENS